MPEDTVRAGIVSIITESLYDKPIVVFREYIQNAADAFAKTSDTEDAEDFAAHIWMVDNDLVFLDNGGGIESNRFKETMYKIGSSDKRKTRNLGYKGIGRLSGIPYCSKLSFINITDYRSQKFQEFTVDCNGYRDIQKTELYYNQSFVDLMSTIGSFKKRTAKNAFKVVEGHDDLFDNRNTGFLVILQDIASVLKNAIEDDGFLNELGWLLPVPFWPELLAPTDANSHDELFRDLSVPTNSNEATSIPARSFQVFYNQKQVFRPLRSEMIRTYLCKSNLDTYAVCVHSFSNKSIELSKSKNNPFSGIRLYIDNMLLCDENELIPVLQQYGMLRHGLYETIQSVRGMGALIFITDKVNISANARRTFIDVTDEDAYNFLELIGEFVETIYTARYALSEYNSAKRKDDVSEEKIKAAKEKALQSLKVLARNEIRLEVEETPKSLDFDQMTPTEQKRIVKTTINKELNAQIRRFLAQTVHFDPDTCYDDFKLWLSAN